MTHPNNISYDLEDLFDEDLIILQNFMDTLRVLKLATPKEMQVILKEKTMRVVHSIKDHR